ncbi:MAG: lysozyme [Clostridia bacterium]|nr:lysozyme [Clostridia bacterium]
MNTTKRYALIILGLLTISIANAQYRMSKHGIESIKKYESCSLTAYWDSNGYSIGYGHHSKNVKKGMRISQWKAEQLFKKDIQNTEKICNRLLSDFDCKFSQGFIDGFCDLIYNCGEGAVKNSNFYTKLKRCRIRKGKINKNDLNYTIALVKKMRISEPGHKARRYDAHIRMLS